ncbi:THAP domain-containing protein 4-like [Diaphorina citri]|uniref:THAP domain-containing protein 4-like n=1 Tax=Diaphorina citri TaxID=121845 RepID=A0A1S3DNT4_DIACI|nr:THAP domain-containing protein 4-like [Diaphorina citri]
MRYLFYQYLSFSLFNIYLFSCEGKEGINSRRDTSFNMSMNNLQWLKGTWKSISAQGIYPTINSFKYIETLSITQPKNKPYFNYLSNTINNEEIQQPMHCEYGFIRLLPNNSICLQLAHNFGVNTVEKGVLSDVNDKEVSFERYLHSSSVEIQNPDQSKE